MHLTDKADFGVLYDAEVLHQKSLGKQLNFTREQWISSCSHLPSIGFAKDGMAFGGAVFYEHEIHFALLPQFHGRWGALIRPMWEWMFSIEDNVRARVEKENPKCLDFMRRQWPEDGEDETYVYFRLTRAGLNGSRKPRAMPAVQACPAPPANRASEVEAVA
ncbi:MAG: hypothetical protein ACRYF5_13575 [Janthinobacterium lividum]